MSDALHSHFAVKATCPLTGSSLVLPGVYATSQEAIDATFADPAHSCHQLEVVRVPTPRLYEWPDPDAVKVEPVTTTKGSA